VNARAALLLIPALAVAATFLAGCSHDRPPPRKSSGHEAIEEWERRHPAASKDLGTWVHEHPDAAERFFDWDAHHPGAAESFVQWSLAKPNADIDDFASTHRSWDRFNYIMEHHKGAANGFMAWCRRHPDASRDLMHYPSGLHWAGQHLYHSYWDMKAGGK
jgi:hypothetical protein